MTEPINVTSLARSLAGHDKNKVFAVMAEDDQFYLLSDGRTRTIAHPKKKKKKHVQIISHLPEELLELAEVSEDAHIRRLIKAYEQRNNEEDPAYPRVM